MKLLPLLTRRLSTARVVRSMSSAAAAVPNMASIREAAGGHYLKTLVADNPYTDVVQYEHQNRTFTVNDIEKNADALAIGIAENGLQSGDVVLSYLPEHFNEQVRAVFLSSMFRLVLFFLTILIII
jgi:non-ribosomal peptide synthetase component E (peptide arylation enzyme)